MESLPSKTMKHFRTKNATNDIISLTTTRVPFKVIVDTKEDLKDSQHGSVVIPKNIKRRIRFLGNRSDDERNVFHLYNAFNNGVHVVTLKTRKYPF